MKSEFIIRFFKYCAVGVLNTGISYIIFAGLHFFGVSPHTALAISYICGMGTSYAVNAKWTFRRTAWNVRDALVFCVTNGVMLLISEGSLNLLLRHIANAYAAQAVNLVPITILGFIANQVIVFTARTKRVQLDGELKGGKAE